MIIALHDLERKYSVLVNLDNVTYIEPMSGGVGSVVYFNNSVATGHAWTRVTESILDINEIITHEHDA